MENIRLTPSALRALPLELFDEAALESKSLYS
jgi:hypothetical protein